MKLPELFVFVSAEYLTLEEFLAVLSGVFFANDNAKKAWLIQYLNSSHKV